MTERDWEIIDDMFKWTIHKFSEYQFLPHDYQANSVMQHKRCSEIWETWRRLDEYRKQTDPAAVETADDQ